jgi:hypothetical protein
MDTSEPTVLPTVPETGDIVKEKKKRSPSTKIIGSRCQVYRGNATHTSGRLTKDDLIKNQHGRIVSKKRHEQGKLAIQYLEKGGYKGVLPSKRTKKVGGSESEPSAVPILDK